MLRCDEILDPRSAKLTILIEVIVLSTVVQAILDLVALQRVVSLIVYKVTFIGIGNWYFPRGIIKTIRHIVMNSITN